MLADRAAWGSLAPDAFGLFAWAAGTGAMLAPHAAGGVRCRSGSSAPLPPGIVAALDLHGPAVRASLVATHAALGRRGMAGWPVVPPELLTVCGWADAWRPVLRPNETARWAHAARLHARSGAARWFAVARAMEDVRLEYPDVWRHDRYAARDVLRVTRYGVTVPPGDDRGRFAIDPRMCDRRAARPVGGVGRPFPARTGLTYETTGIIGAGHSHRSSPSSPCSSPSTPSINAD